MIVLPMPHDGNCLFHSLASFFQSKTIDHALVRRMVVDYVYRNGAVFSRDVQAEGYANVEAYCRKLAQNHQWGDGIALQAFAMLFKVNVWLTLADDDATPPTSISSFPGRPNLGLLLRGNHYDRILEY